MKQTPFDRSGACLSERCFRRACQRCGSFLQRNTCSHTPAAGKFFRDGRLCDLLHRQKSALRQIRGHKSLGLFSGRFMLAKPSRMAGDRRALLTIRSTSPPNFAAACASIAATSKLFPSLSPKDFMCRFVIFEHTGSDMIGTIEAALIKQIARLEYRRWTVSAITILAKADTNRHGQIGM